MLIILRLATSPFFVLTSIVILTFLIISFTSFVRAFYGCHFVGQLNLLCNSIPNHVDAIPIVQSLKYSITTNHYEIEVVLNFEWFDIRFTNNHVGVTTVFGSLGFDVSKGFRYRKSTGKNSQWPLNIKVFLSWLTSSFGKGLGPIDLATSGLNSDLLKLIIRFVVSWENTNRSSCIDGHDCPWITNINNIDYIINYHNNRGTRSWALWAYILARH